MRYWPFGLLATDELELTESRPVDGLQTSGFQPALCGTLQTDKRLRGKSNLNRKYTILINLRTVAIIPDRYPWKDSKDEDAQNTLCRTTMDASCNLVHLGCKLLRTFKIEQ